MRPPEPQTAPILDGEPSPVLAIDVHHPLASRRYYLDLGGVGLSGMISGRFPGPLIALVKALDLRNLPCTWCGELVPESASECPECSHNPAEYEIPCPRCSGRGEVEVTARVHVRGYGRVQHPAYSDRVECSECHGLGETDTPYARERYDAEQAGYIRRPMNAPAIQEK